MGRRRKRRHYPHQRKSLTRRLFRNRYRPDSPWVSLADVILNAKEIAYRFWYRVPPRSGLRWDKDRIRGHYTR